jgi:ParB-like chromosome segregation protein Spo0J
MSRVMDGAVRTGMRLLPQELGERFATVRLLARSDPQMAASLRRYGQLSPLVAFRDSQQQLEVVDGFRRRRAAAAHGYPARLEVRVLELDEPSALGALFALHRGNSGLCELEQAWLVQALVRQHGLEQAQAAQLLRRHPSWVSRRLLLVEALSAEVQMDVRLGLVSPTMARELARLPRGTQPVVARVIAHEALSTRHAARLCKAAEQLGAPSVEQIADLARTLGALSRPRVERRTQAETVLADLALLAELASRLRRWLCGRTVAERAAPSDAQMDGLIRSAVPLLEVLLEAMRATVERA